MRRPQDKSADLCSIPGRIEKLRILTQLNWAEVAARLGLSESMIYQVKSGRRSMSSKSLYRLAAAETAAGIMTPLEDILDRSVKAGDELADTIRKIMDSGEWNEDLAGQLKAFLGQRALARSLLESWSKLEISIRTFLGNVQGAIGTPKSLAAGIEEGDIGLLHSDLEAFRAELEVFVENAAEIESA